MQPQNERLNHCKLECKNAVWIFREFEGKRRNFSGMHFWCGATS